MPGSPWPGWVDVWLSVDGCSTNLGSGPTLSLTSCVNLAKWLPLPPPSHLQDERTFRLPYRNKSKFQCDGVSRKMSRIFCVSHRLWASADFKDRL